MDTNKDGEVSRKERRQFERQAPEAVASKWGLSYALVTQLSQSADADAQAMARWFEGKTREYISNPTGFSDRAFIEEFDAQPWAQKYKRAAIEDMDFEAQFPDLYRQAVDADIEVLRDEAVQSGAQFTDDELRELAKQKRRFGLNESQMRNTLAEAAFAKDGRVRGTAGQLQTGLKEWARRNGIGLSDAMVNDYARRIQAGDTTESDVLQDLRQTYLAGAYPAWADRIAAGQDIADIAAPYRQRVAQLLEINEDQIDLSDQLLQRGLQGVGPDGKPRVTPLYEFEQEIRKDPRWEFTDNAYDVYSRVGENLLRTFGFR
jgi:hypothetical protein